MVFPQDQRKQWLSPFWDPVDDGTILFVFPCFTVPRKELCLHAACCMFVDAARPSNASHATSHSEGKGNVSFKQFPADLVLGNETNPSESTGKQIPVCSGVRVPHVLTYTDTMSRDIRARSLVRSVLGKFLSVCMWNLFPFCFFFETGNCFFVNCFPPWMFCCLFCSIRTSACM